MEKKFIISFQQPFCTPTTAGCMEKLQGVGKCFYLKKYKTDESSDYDVPEKIAEKMPFAFPPIVIIGLLLVTVALVAVFMNYWIWYKTSSLKYSGLCSSSFAVGMSTATHLTTDTSILIRGIFKPCHRLIDVVEVENEIQSRANVRIDSKKLQTTLYQRQVSKLLTSK